MASYPGAKVHRPSRRKLPRGQHTQAPSAIATLTPSGSNVTIAFDQPVVVYGNLDLNLGGGTVPTLVSQTVLSTTAVLQVYSGAVATHTWAISGVNTKVRTYLGGSVAPAAGTF
jgi:hypothetical protein